VYHPVHHPSTLDLAMAAMLVATSVVLHLLNMTSLLVLSMAATTHPSVDTQI